MLQIVPVTAPLGYVATEPCVVQYVSNVNRWIWDLRQGGSTLIAFNRVYGQDTEQFAELAALWETYRLDAVSVEFVPSQTGAGQQTAMISAIQPAGEPENFDPATALESISRLRSVTLSDSRKPCRRALDYRSWLQQCCPQPYLQTIDATLATGARQSYPTGTNNVAPLIRMAFQTTPGISGPGLTLGFFRINAKYTVRGRRAQVLPVSMRLMLWTPTEREEALRQLERERVLAVTQRIV